MGSRHPELLLLVLSAALAPRLGVGCDAGVFFGKNCTQELAENNDPACVAWPQNANATSAYSVLEWQKGGAGFGGMNDLGGDVFLSTMLNLGCGGGYFGSQMHFNTSAMNLDWAVWDIGVPGAPANCPGGKPCSTMSAHPVNPTNSNGKPVDRQGNLCSSTEPPPKGFTGCPCSRYSGEGFGVHCGIGKSDGFLWEIGTPYTLNVSLDATVKNDASAATFQCKSTLTQPHHILIPGTSQSGRCDCSHGHQHEEQQGDRDRQDSND